MGFLSKTFKKITRSVKKFVKKVVSSPIGRIAVGLGVGFLTAGLGAKLLGSIAPSLSTGLLGKVLGGAIGGVVAGGLTSAITGGSVSQGMLLGAVGGAIGGGLSHAMSTPATGASPAAGAKGAAAVPTTPPGPHATVSPVANSPAVGLPVGNPSASVGQAGHINPNGTVSAGAATPASGGIGSTVGGWIDDAEAWATKHPLSTEVIGGVAKGGIEMLAASDAEAEAYEGRNRILEKRHADEQANIAWQRAQMDGATSGLLSASHMGARSAPNGARTPAQTYAYPGVQSGSRIQWNPTTGRLETTATA